MKELTVNDESYLSYETKSGRFFTFDKAANKLENLFVCRVEFAWRFRYAKQRWVGFYSSACDIENFAKLFEEIESRLGFKNKSKIFKIARLANHKNNGFILHLNPFWTTNDTNRSLLTLLIRGLTVFFKNNIDESLDNYPLSKRCHLAINLFLDGFNNPTYENWTRRDEEGYYGFVAQFENRTGEEIKKYLTNKK